MSDRAIKPKLSGTQLIRALYHLVNAVRLHQDNNQLIKDCLNQFNGVIGEISADEDITIRIWRGRFHIQDERILFRRDNYTVINEMLDYFSRRGLVGFCLFATFRNTRPENLLTLVRLLNESIKHDEPLDWLNSQLDEAGFSWVELYRVQDEKATNLDPQHKEMAWNTYLAAMNVVKEVAEKVSGGVAGVRKARRLAQTIVDLVHEDYSLMLGLATIRDYDDYTYTHSVNVAFFATCLGRYVGLSQVFLEHLAVCGLFHDLGKVGVSKEILLKPGVLNAEEWDTMRRHPLIGTRKILRLQAPHSLKSRIILGPFEHHLNPDLTGYPQTHFMKHLSLFGKILRIVDVYEALTAQRSYRPRSYSPDEALCQMWSERGRSFDPLLLKSFINMMGVYPIGSILELNTGEIGLVIDYPDESQKTLPLIMLLDADSKGGYISGELVNLADQRDAADGVFRSIVRGVHASKLGIQPSQYFLQEPRLTGLED
ncbi:MAG TPA: HD domain-containing protein [Deltaproteobacteria bacterium]|nr:HD domain-containing protein [Deltaproteobacteria bacterium]